MPFTLKGFRGSEGDSCAPAGRRSKTCPANSSAVPLTRGSCLEGRPGSESSSLQTSSQFQGLKVRSRLGSSIQRSHHRIPAPVLSDRTRLPDNDNKNKIVRAIDSNVSWTGKFHQVQKSFQELVSLFKPVNLF